MPDTFREIVPGNPLSAGQMNPYLQRVREISPLFGDGRYIEVTPTPHGTTIRFLGQIAPPGGGSLTVMKVTGTAPRYGVYEVAIGVPSEVPIDPQVVGTLTATTVYTFDADNSAWFINIDEIGSDQPHELDLDTLVAGTLRPTAATDGAAMYEGTTIVPRGTLRGQALVMVSDSARDWSYVELLP